MLRLRLASGLPLDLLDAPGRAPPARARRRRPARAAAVHRGPAVLTRRGRLLADRVVTDLLAAAPVGS